MAQYCNSILYRYTAEFVGIVSMGQVGVKQFSVVNQVFLFLFLFLFLLLSERARSSGNG